MPNAAAAMRARERSLSEWAVLGALATGASHGFAAARDLEPGGRIGRVWSVTRPLVYRAIASLIEAGLVQERGIEAGGPGPRRHVLHVTPEGLRLLDGFLVAPVEHVRDFRSALMLKLLLLEGRPTARAELVRAQRRLLAPLCEGLAAKAEEATGFDALLARFRLEHALAATRFLDGLDPAPAPSTSPSGRP